MKKILTFLFLSLIFVVLACSDNSTNPQDNQGEVKCQIRDDIVLDFSSDSIYLESFKADNFRMRILKAFMTVGIEKHVLSIYLNDYLDGKKEYHLGIGVGQIAYEIIGQADYHFASDSVGTVTVTTLDDSTWIGTFHFEAKNKSESKEISGINGTLNVKR